MGPHIRCRQISESDIDSVASLLTRGFSRHNRQFWLRALAQLRDRRSPDGFPKYGYLLESNGAPVGALLLIFSALGTGGSSIRCNVSSWYVEPEFRGYASMLVSQALRHKNVTYMNVSPAPNTWPIIEAQGFSRYCNGIFIAAPALNMFTADGVKVVKAKAAGGDFYDPVEQDLLLQHAELGCISLWCVGKEQAYPFVFRPRVVRAVIPCVQLIYCREIADFVRFAGSIGWYLATRGRPLVIIDSNEPIPGLVGVFRHGRMPKYFKGSEPPRLGDLAFTEYAMLGV
jgi:hypothetical protein